MSEQPKSTVDDPDAARPAYVTDRLRYYDGEFLSTQSFIDEQNYHVDRQVRHERTLHVAGILEGLEVTQAVDQNGAPIPYTVTVGQGSALDVYGNQILLWNPDPSVPSPQTFPQPPLDGNAVYCVDVLFGEPSAATDGAEASRFRQDYTQVVQVSSTQRVDSVLIAVVTTDSEGAVTISTTGAPPGKAGYAGHHLPGPAGKSATLRVDDVTTDLAGSPDYRVVLDQSLYLKDSSLELDGSLYFHGDSQIFAGGYDRRILLEGDALELQAGKQIILSTGMNADDRWASQYSVVVSQSGDVGVGTGGATTSSGATGNAISARLEIKGDGVKPAFNILSTSTSGSLFQVAKDGTTTASGLLTAQSGVTIGSGVLTFPPIPTRDGNDPPPIITSRLIPSSQCGGTNSSSSAGNDQQRSELILFHSNDGFNGYGPDFITLRAPAIRLQTFNGGVTSIDNDAGSLDALYVDPTGKVGIGTAAPAANNAYPNMPSAQLDVKAASGNVALNVTGNGATALVVNGASGQSALKVMTSGVSSLEVKDTGRVGIGTTAPSAQLDVKAASSTPGLKVTSASGQSAVEVVGSGGATLLSVADGGAIIASGQVTAQAGLTVSGNVGIGTTTPSANLEVKGAFKATNTAGTNSLLYDGTDLYLTVGARGTGGRPFVHDNNDILTINYASAFKGGVTINGAVSAPGTLMVSGLVTASNGLDVTKSLNVTGVSATALSVKGATGQSALVVLSSAGATVLRVDENGRLGVNTGTSTPNATLDVRSVGGVTGLNVTGNNGTAVNIQSASGKSGLVVANSGNTTLLRLDDNGRLGLGLGTTAPAATLDVKAVSGTSGLQVKNSSGTTMLQVTDSGVTVSNGLLTASKGLTVSGGPVSVMCSWQTMSVTTSYTAATDGFVLASIQKSGDDQHGTIYGYSENMSTSIAMASLHYNDSTGTNFYIRSSSFLMPVKKGAQWKVTSDSLKGSPAIVVSWMPLGQS
jgi:hypothetical protein